MADLSLVFDLIARDRASSEVKKVGDSMDNAGKRASGFGTFVKTAMLATGAGVIGAAVGLYKVGATFDDMSDTIRVGTGATGKSLAGLTASAENIGRTVPASFDQIGGTVADVNTRLGLTGPVLEKLSGQILNAGRMLGEKVDVGKLSAAFSAFGVTGGRTTAVMDDLYRVSQATGVGINDLAAGVAKGAPQLKQFGFSISDSAALLGSLDKAGLNSDKTVAGLNKAMISFAKAGKDPKRALEDTVTSIQRFTKSGNQAGALNLAAKLFGTKGATQFVAAVKSGKFSVDNLMKSTGATTDTISKAANDTADFSEKWQLFKNNALLALEPVATRVFNALGDGMGWLTNVGGPALASIAGIVRRNLGPALDGVAKFLTGVLWPALKAVFGFLFRNRQTVMIVAGVIAGLLVPALVVWGVQSTIAGVKAAAAWVSSSAQAVWGAARQAASAYRVIASWVLMGAQAVFQGLRIAAVWTGQIVASAVRGAVSFVVQVARVVAGWVLMGIQSLLQAGRMAAAWFIALGPVGWVIAAVIGIVILIIANWKRVVAWTTTAWHAVTGAITGAWHAVIGAITTAWAWIQGKVSAAWAWVKSITGSAWNAVAGAIRGAWNKITGWISGAWTTIRTAVSNGISKAIDLVKGLPGKIWNVLKGADKWLYDTGKNIITGLINGAGSLLKNIGRMFLKIVPGFIRGPFESALGIGSPSTVFAEYGRNVGQGLINGLTGMQSAIGGTVGGLLDGGGGLGFTVPRYDLGGAGAGGRGAATYVTTVSGVASPEAVAAQVVRAQRTNEFLAGVGT